MEKFSRVVRANSGYSGFALALFLFFLGSCSQSMPVPDAQPQPITHVIEIKKFQFKPQILAVPAGDFVRWENRDIVPHQIAEETLKKWKSRDLLPGDSFTLQVKESTAYICKLHPTMQAKIVVR